MKKKDFIETLTEENIKWLQFWDIDFPEMLDRLPEKPASSLSTVELKVKSRINQNKIKIKFS